MREKAGMEKNGIKSMKWKGKGYVSMKKEKSRLDEMQEQKMLHVEHNGYWVGYIGLAAAILIQILYYGPGLFRTGHRGVYRLYVPVRPDDCGCMKYGIWDRKLAPTWRVVVCGSLIAGAVGVIFNFLLLYVRERALKECVSGAVRLGSSIFVCCFIGLTVLLVTYRLRERKLEGDDDKDEN